MGSGGLGKSFSSAGKRKGDAVSTAGGPGRGRRSWAVWKAGRSARVAWALQDQPQCPAVLRLRVSTPGGAVPRPFGSEPGWTAVKSKAASCQAASPLTLPCPAGPQPLLQGGGGVRAPAVRPPDAKSVGGCRPGQGWPAAALGLGPRRLPGSGRAGQALHAQRRTARAATSVLLAPGPPRSLVSCAEPAPSAGRHGRQRHHVSEPCSPGQGACPVRSGPSGGKGRGTQRVQDRAACSGGGLRSCRQPRPRLTGQRGLPGGKWHREPSCGMKGPRASPSLGEKTAQTVLVVVVVFGISWLPHHVIRLWVEFGHFPLTPASFLFRITAHCLAYSNSSVNPIIYAFLSENFRKAYKQVFRCRLRGRSPLRDAKESRSRADTPPSTNCSHM
ncbi:Galanin receptor type 1 [Galemys pyrenaicus]|uniref:Galanin receptor type 1 n=1 Tax=Galemys pyrenaicus TaxID=202257 RepID=A0A8J6DDY3_GALPY|nr:Galanin receptor type 1 [Galemys pyrenaicus]